MWNRWTSLAWGLAATLGATSLVRGDPRAAPALVVVVGKTSAIATVDTDVLRDVYLRRRRLWADGRRAIPVNLPADSPYRLAFSRRVLGRLPTELVEYWNRLYFDGIRPPLVLRSPAAACAYVATEPAALAYLPADAVDTESCRVIMVLQ